jgi:hypothetical protein
MIFITLGYTFLPNPGPDLVQDLPAKNLNVVDPFDYLTPFPPSHGPNIRTKFLNWGVDDPFFKNYF